MSRLPVLLCVTTALVACITTGPDDNVGFGQVNSVHDCAGVYRNRGEGSTSVNPVYLSSFIWPSDTSLDHAAIDSVEIRAADDATLWIKGLDGSRVVKEGALVQGKDFDFDSGRIRLRTWHGQGLFPVTIGSDSGTVEIGLDQRGDGKLRWDETFAGLVAFIPMAFETEADIRFVRISR